MLRTITAQEIAQMEDFFRRTFVNSLTGFKSVCLVGTQDKEGKTNLAIFSQIIHIGANPPLIGILVRPEKSPRHTLSNIEATRCFTLNHIREEFYQQAHQTSARYPKEISEFDACGFTPVYSSLLPHAPYVQESNIRIGLEFAERINIQLNDTILIIGKIIEVIFPKECLWHDGYLDIEQAGTITSSALDSYHTTKRLARLQYAKPNLPVRELNRL
ncbi:MAG: flavin reductase [Cytophagales bacterium]|nr:flavin reductase [Cytophagales bacterium]MDW8384315.1 flavin reductase [Flammeovirgaceae bacterium]